jgi:hypothetical protein
MRKIPKATAKVARSSKVVRLNGEDAVSVTPEHSIGEELLLVHFKGLHFFLL